MPLQVAVIVNCVDDKFLVGGSLTKVERPRDWRGIVA